MRSSRRTADGGGGGDKQPARQGGLRRQVAPPAVYSPEVGPSRVGRRHRREGADGGEPGSKRASKNEHVKRIHNLIGNIRTSAALLEAYNADGWRGTNREKLQPTAELQKARQRIAQAKLAIRDCLRLLDEAGGDVAIDAALFDADGEVEERHIFCARCSSAEADDDNDIVLCDGPCCRAYHLSCLGISAADLPPDDIGWLCPSCDAKCDALDAINTAFDTDWELDTPWSAVFAGEDGAGGPDGAGPGAQAEAGLPEAWPSDESGDSDFDPAASSDSDAAAEQPAGAEMDVDGDGDGDGDDSGASTDSDGESEPDTEPSAGEAPGGGRSRGRPRTRATAGEVEDSESGSLPSEESESEEAPLILEGKRRRTAVDYVALNGEMFGGVSDVGEDDDEWRSNCGSPMSPLSPGQGGARRSGWHGTGDGEAGGAPRQRAKPQKSALGGPGRGFPPAIVEQLRAVFDANPLPGRDAKEALSQKTGLTVAQISIWMNNQRQRAAGTYGPAAVRKKREQSTGEGAAGAALQALGADAPGAEAAA